MTAAGGGTDPTTAQNMNESGIDGKLTGYVTSLTNYLNTYFPNKPNRRHRPGRTIIWEDTSRTHHRHPLLLRLTCRCNGKLLSYGDHQSRWHRQSDPDPSNRGGKARLAMVYDSTGTMATLLLDDAVVRLRARQTVRPPLMCR